MRQIRCNCGILIKVTLPHIPDRISNDVFQHMGNWPISCLTPSRTILSGFLLTESHYTFIVNISTSLLIYSILNKFLMNTPCLNCIRTYTLRLLTSKRKSGSSSVIFDSFAIIFTPRVCPKITWTKGRLVTKSCQIPTTNNCLTSILVCKKGFTVKDLFHLFRNRVKFGFTVILGVIYQHILDVLDGFFAKFLYFLIN